MNEIKNLKKVADRIKKAVKNKEKIILYGDADLDGSGSVIILEESIKNLGGEVSAVYFPDRTIEGYGLNEKALDTLKNFSPALLIISDCGIGNIKEIDIAKKMGFETIIIDHHEVLEKLPKASIIVDPKQKGDKYPFKSFSAAGVVFKLAELLLEDQLNDSLKRNFLELVALATIADMMPQEKENKVYIEEGLKSFENSWRPGIRAFFETQQFKEFPNLSYKISKIIAILNVRDVERNLPANYRLLISRSSEEAKKIISILVEKSDLRKEKIRQVLEELEEKLSEYTDEVIIFEGNSFWEIPYLSPAASIVCHQYQKPTFIFKIDKEESQGAVRMPKGLNGVEAMKSCAKLFETYGGHAAAAGFRIKNKKLDKLKECLIKYFEEKL